MFNFVLQPSGGKYVIDRDRESILSKKSVVRIVNNDDNCFWCALSIVLNKENNPLKDNRNTKLREKVAKDLCNKCKLKWDTPVDFSQLPIIEEALNCNIFVMDLDIYLF